MMLSGLWVLSFVAKIDSKWVFKPTNMREISLASIQPCLGSCYGPDVPFKVLLCPWCPVQGLVMALMSRSGSCYGPDIQFRVLLWPWYLVQDLVMALISSSGSCYGPDVPFRVVLWQWWPVQGFVMVMMSSLGSCYSPKVPSKEPNFNYLLIDNPLTNG